MSSLAYRGVSSSSMFIFYSACPDLVFIPTAQTRALALPVVIKVFAYMNGDGLY